MAARIGLQNSATKQTFFFHYFFFLFLFINVCAKVYFISLIRDTRQSNQRLQNQKQEYTTFLLAYKITEIHSSSLSFSLFHLSLVFHFLYPSSPSFSLFLWPSHHCLSLSPLPFCRYVYVFFFGGGVITMFHFQSLSAKKIYKLHKK